MNYTRRIFTVFVSLLMAFCVTGQVSQFDIEDVMFKDSVNQPFPTVQSNLIIKLSPNDFSSVDTIHIKGVNQLAGSITKHTATIDPKTGFVINDATVRSIVKEYLIQKIDFETTQSQIRKHLQDTRLYIHPLVFVDPEQNTYLIKMFDQNSGEVSFNYDVRVELKDGKYADIEQDQATIINNVLATNVKN